MVDDKTRLTAAEALTRYLSEHHLRRTPERFAILGKILGMKCHFFAETLFESLENDGYHVSRATVYNTIQLLVDASIVRRHQFDGQAAQYELIADSAASNHQHLVCLRCGKVKEIRDQSMVKALTGRRYQGFTAQYFAFYVYGICSQCRRREARKSSVKNSNTLT